MDLFFFGFTCPVSSHRPSFLDTYSADFQKCPGWDSLRLSLGSFSSMSASCVKVGLSLRSYAQQAERISWDDKPLWVNAPGQSTEPCAHRTVDYEWRSIEKVSQTCWYLCITRAWFIIYRSHTSRINIHFSDWLVLLFQLTVTSLPRLISAKTFFIPSPLPTCQMVASTGWLVIGQSLAWSSYQMVLKKGRKAKSIIYSVKLFSVRNTCHSTAELKNKLSKRWDV